MFGDASWFRPKQWGWGLEPVTWQGWAYTAGWVSVMLFPFFGLFFSGKWMESLAWMLLSGGALVYDVHLILAAMNAPTAPIDQTIATAETSEEPSDERKYDFYIQ